MSDRTIEMTTAVQAPPETVFRALTDAGELVRWFASAADSDPRPGGAFSYRYEFEEDQSRNHTYSGEYRDVRPNELVAYPWNARLGTTQVEFRLRPVADGTEVELTHSGWGDGADWEESLEMHRAGWAFFLGNLRAYLERGEDARAEAMGMKVAMTA